MIAIPPEVARKLGYYVYALVDPRTGLPFYVGKGKGRRVLDHFSEVAESRKREMIKALDRECLEPGIDILAHALPDEESAFRIEAAVIDAFGLKGLTNQIRGWRSIETGRIPLKQAIAYYAAMPVRIIHPALLVRVNQLYRHNITSTELYEITRGVWRLGTRRESALFALAVFEGVVREVYTIRSWHPAGSTPYSTRDLADVRVLGRWEFTGQVAPNSVRDRYFNRSVARYFVRGQQSPVVYAKC